MEEQLSISELQSLIIQWAKDKNLNDFKAQYVKCHEEMGELARGILKNDKPLIYDSIGDVAVTFIIFNWQINDFTVTPMPLNEFDEDVLDLSANELFAAFVNSTQEQGVSEIFTMLNVLAAKYDSTLQECLNIAWNEIKDRQGKTVNGTFIKN